MFHPNRKQTCKSSRVNAWCFWVIWACPHHGPLQVNTRQIALWDQVGSKLFNATRPPRISQHIPSDMRVNMQEDLSAPITEEGDGRPCPVSSSPSMMLTHTCFIWPEGERLSLRQSESCRTVGHLTGRDRLSSTGRRKHQVLWGGVLRNPFLQFLMEFRSPAPQRVWVSYWSPKTFTNYITLQAKVQYQGKQCNANEHISFHLFYNLMVSIKILV